MLTVIEVDAASFFAVIVVAAIAAVLVVVIPRPYAPPVVVLELILGILIGPQVLGIADSDNFIDFFSNLGLGMLFFFAGYEIDFDRIRGKPIKLGGWGWAALAGARLRDRRRAGRPPGSSSRSSTPDRRWRRRRSAR